MEPSSDSYVVAGYVRDENGKPVNNVSIHVVDKDLRGENILGDTRTDQEGYYRLEFPESKFRRTEQERGGPDLVVSVLDPAGATLAASRKIGNASQQETVDLTIPSRPEVTYQITGRVLSHLSAGVGGLQVSIVDMNVNGDVLLARAVTDDKGVYHVTFTDADLRKRGKTIADLQARVHAGETLLGASEVHYNASPSRTLNVLLDDRATSRLRSEHEVLTSTLARQFAGPLRDIKETDHQRDITYLANKTGWDARAVALAALAEQFSTRTADAARAPAIPPPFFYALFRAGLPANEDTLYHTNAKAAKAVWKQAVEQNIIPDTLADQIPDVVERFQAMSAEKLLTEPALIGTSSFQEMMTVSGLDTAQQATFAQLYAEHSNDMPALWQAVGEALGQEVANRLQLDGKLAYLTINNAPLMHKVHQAVGSVGLTDTVELVTNGYYRAEKWLSLIDDNGIPPEISGENVSEKRTHYAEMMAAVVRLSYPTAAVAQMVKTGMTSVGEQVQVPVHDFLMQHHAKFDIGSQAVEQYTQQNKLEVSPDVIKAVTRIQRVYQLTPGDDVMNALLKRGVDSAYKVIRYKRDDFIRSFREDLGGESNAQLVYTKAQEVHNTILNIVTSYLIAKNAVPIGSHSSPHFIDPSPMEIPQYATDVIAYPTMEKLLGEIDYCDCEHCRSILSPAAYLVNLLQFLELKTDEVTKSTEVQPLTVLLQRRPDIEYLPLTCENTNIPILYIDLVNETLEYYVSNKFSLENYMGRSTDSDMKPEELLASPQFVNAQAYEILKHAAFPPPLPFHKHLEELRRYFDKFEITLSKAMEVLRQNDDLERPQPADPKNPVEYGWRDILMEELKLSRPEYELLTAEEVTLQQFYGYPSSTSLQELQTELSGAKVFSLRVGISYEELVEILKTRFINPNADLLPKLEKLHVPFVTLKMLYQSSATGAEWLNLLPKPLPDASHYGDDIEKWVKNPSNYAKYMSIITLTEKPNSKIDICSFDGLDFRYSDPDKITAAIRPLEFIRLIRFIRLWKKLGWTIEQTDHVITALYPPNQAPNDPNDNENRKRLDAGFKVLLARLGAVKRLIDALKLKIKQDLLPLLACFAPMDTYGDGSLYRQLFLSPSLLEQDDVFADDGYGYFLDGSEKLSNHTEVLRSACKLTSDEFDLITSNLPFDPNRIDRDEQKILLLTVRNVSAIFGRGWLARKLKLSVRELLLMIQVTGLDPFNPPDAPKPSIERLYALVERFRVLALKPTETLYLIWNQDISGKSTPEAGQITEFARALRAGLSAVELEFSVVSDPDGQVSRSRMIQVYGSEATDFFFGLIGNTLTTEVDYDHHKETLEQVILDAAPGHIVYDDFRKRLSFSGVLTEKFYDALKALNNVASDFPAAIESLYSQNQKMVEPFFARYAELQPLHDAFVFFGELNSSVPYSQTDDRLADNILVAGEGRLTYSAKNHQLMYKGVISEDVRNALHEAAGSTAVAFNSAIESLYTSNQEAIKEFFTAHAQLEKMKDTYLAANDSLQLRYSLLLAEFLPELIHRRKRQQCLQALSTAANTDLRSTSTLLNSYVDNEGTLHTPGGTDLPNLSNMDTNTGNRWVLHAVNDAARPALDDFMKVETVGLSATFSYGSNTLTRDAEASLNYAPGGNSLPSNPAGSISGKWSGFLEAPENGFYNFGVNVDAEATVVLTIDGKVVALALEKDSGSAADSKFKRLTNGVSIEFRAGKLYPFELTIDTVKDRMILRWQTRGRGWELIPPRYLYPANIVNQLHNIYVRFLKTTSLTFGLKLAAAEIAYLATRSSYWIHEQGWVNSLPVVGNLDDEIRDKVFTAFSALLDFARIKAALAPTPDDDRLLVVFKNPSVKALDGKTPLLDELTHWQPESRKALLIRFGKTKIGQPNEEVIDQLKELDVFSRVYDAYSLLKQVGVGASTLIRAATNEPGDKAVQDFKKALRARYEQTDWLQVIKPINDELRGLQRDGLVAHILHQMSLNQETKDRIDTPDKLFEYFLMDVQMDSCMQTSRIRHAISSVQLFIERCLMGLEPRVPASIIDGKRWKVMKRYRLQEANLKVFLWPENWMLPQYRDDQSPFFKETMSELLQSDITVERAETAVLNYLANLDKIARLEPCGIHYVQEEDRTKGVAHVVARTSGAQERKYFYRRRESTGWTAWEEIKLDIEDKPTIPVIWKDRLFLFWLKILKDTPSGATPPPNKSAAEMQPGNLIGEEQKKIKVRAMLCWSEYLGGKWQPVKTSDTDKTIIVDTCLPENFDRSLRNLFAFQRHFEPRLAIGPWIRSTARGYMLYNANSEPQPIEYELFDYIPLSREMSEDGADFKITYLRPSGQKISRTILASDILHQTIVPQHEFFDPWKAEWKAEWQAPFFYYEDSRHVFYVKTKVTSATKLPEKNLVYGWVLSFASAAIEPVIYYEKLGEFVPPSPEVQIDKSRLSVVSGMLDTTQNITKVIRTQSLVTFDGTKIGVNGRVR